MKNKKPPLPKQKKLKLKIEGEPVKHSVNLNERFVFSKMNTPKLKSRQPSLEDISLSDALGPKKVNLTSTQANTPNFDRFRPRTRSFDRDTLAQSQPMGKTLIDLKDKLVEAQSKKVKSKVTKELNKVL